MRRALVLIAVLTGVGAAPAPSRGALPQTIRIWGQGTMRGVIERLAAGFRRHHPDIAFELTLKGSATAIPGLYSGKADIALLARENDAVDDAGFGRVRQYKPLRLELMNGSLAAPGRADALVVLVRGDNPLQRLTLAQLDSIFGSERRRGGRTVRTWGDLGLGGAWRNAPIALHVYDAETGSGTYFQHAVLKDSRKMRWERIQEYRDSRKPDGTLLRAAEQIAAAVRRDHYALGIGSLRYADPDLKAVAVAEAPTGPFVQATAETIVSRQYPLSRRTFAFVDRKPSTPVDPKLADFLGFVLSDEGQSIIASGGDFLPLDEPTRAAQRALLEAR